jgi:hypothetical protein
MPRLSFTAHACWIDVCLALPQVGGFSSELDMPAVRGLGSNAAPGMLRTLQFRRSQTRLPQ